MNHRKRIAHTVKEVEEVSKRVFKKRRPAEKPPEEPDERQRPLVRSEYIKAATNDDFCFLPNEVIHDIIAEAAHTSDPHCLVARFGHECLAKLRGPWGDFARDPKEVSVTLFLNKLIFRTSGPFLAQINELIVEDLNLLMTPNWEKAIDSQRFAEFIRRHLPSKRLRRLSINSANLDRDAFTDALIEFVKKPTFEALNSTTVDSISPQIFKEADKAWRAKKSVEFGFYQEISGLFSAKEADDLLDYFGMPKNQKTIQATLNRSFQRSAKKIIKVEWLEGGSIVFTLKFCNF